MLDKDLGGAMRRKSFQYFIVMIIVLALSLLAGMKAQAGSKTMVATKREVFKDDHVKSMKDVFKQSELEYKEYREKMIANSEETVKLLKEIRDLLQQLNAKE